MSPSRRRRSDNRRRRARRWAGRAAVALGALVFVVAALSLVAFLKLRQARADLAAAATNSQAALDAARDLDFESGRRALLRASDAFIGARAALGGVEFRALRLIPPVRRNVDATRTVAHAGALASAGAIRGLDAARLFPQQDAKPVLPLADGVVDLVPVRRAIPLLEESRRQFDDALRLLDSVSGSLSPGVHRAKEEVSRRLVTASAQAGRAVDGLALVEGALGGPSGRRYLLALENPAEMRGLGGMVLAYGQLDVADGRLTFERVGSVNELRLETPVDVPLPADVEARFGWQKPRQFWQNTNAGLDFPTIAPVLAAMYAHATGVTVDGVILADSLFLARLSELVGPVTIAAAGRTETIEPSRMRQFLLHDQYTLPITSEERHDLLGEVARTLSRPLFAGGFDTRRLGEITGDGMAERRFAVWMRDSAQQDRARRLAADAAIPRNGGDLFAPSIQNHSANKADVFMRPRLTYDADVDGFGVVTVRQTIEIRNTLSPEDLEEEPSYIVGPNDTRVDVPPPPAGWYRAWLSFYSAPGSYLVASPFGAQGDLRTELAHPVLSGYALAGPGQTASATATFVAPAAFDLATGEFRLTVVPQPGPEPPEIRVRVRFPPGQVEALTPGVTVDGSSARLDASLTRPAEIRLGHVPAA